MQSSRALIRCCCTLHYNYTTGPGRLRWIAERNNKKDVFSDYCGAYFNCSLKQPCCCRMQQSFCWLHAPRLGWAFTMSRGDEGTRLIYSCAMLSLLNAALAIVCGRSCRCGNLILAVTSPQLWPPTGADFRAFPLQTKHEPLHSPPLRRTQPLCWNGRRPLLACSVCLLRPTLYCRITWRQVPQGKSPCASTA